MEGRQSRADGAGCLVAKDAGTHFAIWRSFVVQLPISFSVGAVARSYGTAAVQGHCSTCFWGPGSIAGAAVQGSETPALRCGSWVWLGGCKCATY